MSKFIHKKSKIDLEKDKSLFEYADQVRMRIPTSCGRVGDCHECIVEIIEGENNLSEITNEENFLSSPFRLACQAKTIKNEADLSFTPRKRNRKILTSFESENEYKIDNNYKITSQSVIINETENQKILINKKSVIYGLSIDVGTTTVALNLVNLETGKIKATSSFENPQVFGGSDVMNRISYDSTKFKGELHKTIISAINFEVGEITKKIKIRRNQIVEIVIVGNSTMRDIFFNLDVESIGVKPYKSQTEFDFISKKVNSTELKVYASDLELRINPDAIIYSPPLIASHIGSDISAGLIAVDFFSSNQNKIFIDIGTNTEVVLGNGDNFIAASCPAGPAFEGGEITYGMPGYDGAVENVKWDHNKYVYKTIGDSSPLGICGSGLIDFLSEMKDNNFMNSLGKFNSELEYVKLDENHEVMLTRKDVSNLAQAKAANVCGQALVIKDFGINLKDIDEIYLAGGFANYIDIERAKNIGFILNYPTKRIKKIGNSALEGATKLLLSNMLRKKLLEQVTKINHLELETKEEFFDYFVEGCQFKEISI
ncbi:MAG: ASKHA domain-containing protein [Dehalococcoidia bacterium]|nr:ASKHA domain-containing protein [Dehalococcoidia bacterium]